MEAEQFYNKFSAKNSELFDCTLGSQDFHQAVIVIAWHIIFSDSTFNTLDNILAEAADHSVEIDQVYYRRAFSNHPCLTQ